MFDECIVGVIGVGRRCKFVLLGHLLESAGHVVAVITLTRNLAGLECRCAAEVNSNLCPKEYCTLDVFLCVLKHN